MAQLLFFGRLRELAGAGERAMELSHPASISAIIAMIETTDPILAASLVEPDINYAKNGTIVSVETNISNDDELAFLPPVSGG
jgi:molybdopterin converting factor small subunit